MEVAEASRSKGTRSAGRTLELLVVPLNGLILKALEDGPMRLVELRARLGGPAQTTLRGHLSKLIELGAIERCAPGAAPGGVENGLTEMGRELLLVTHVLEAWLASAPQGSVPLGSEAAKGTVRALAGGWQSTMLRAFAARPLSLTQLDRLIGALSYPAIERRLSGLRATGLVEPVEENGDGNPYGITEWGRRGVGPISAAARDSERRLAGVELAVDRGRVASCVSRIGASPRNWALGSSAGWLDALVERSADSLRIGGDRGFVRSVVHGLHDLLVDSVAFST